MAYFLKWWQRVSPPCRPHMLGAEVGKGASRLSLGGGGAHRKAALTPLCLAGGLAFTWFLLFSP